MIRCPRPLALTVAVAWLLAAACGDDAGPASTPPPTDATDEPAVSGDVTVFAAASLTGAFTELGTAFEEDNPGVDVTFSFAASSELVTQIGEGAPADVFASADQSNMTKLTDAGDNGTDPVVFAANALEIVVGPGNPEGITGVEDLADESLIVVTCAVEVPCGAYALELFANAGATVTPKSYEENVKAVVSKVTLGEADAGIAYRTDVIAAGDGVDGVEIPDDVNVRAEYPIAVTKEAANPAAAQAFVDFVLTAPGQEILASYGFLAP